MFKKIALPVVALAAVMMVSSAPAKAAVRFGITVGPPVYSYPAPYAAPYANPYDYPYNNYYNTYPAPAPVYVYPGNRWYGNRDRDWQEHRGREFRDRDDFRGHDDRGRGNFRGGYRR